IRDDRVTGVQTCALPIYRQAVEELAEATGEAQLRVALRTVESARQAAELKSADDRAAHVGYHLIGKGRPDLETDVAYRPRLANQIGRASCRETGGNEAWG